MAKVPFPFRILNQPVTVDLESPRVRMRLDEMLPNLRVLDDACAEASVRRDGQPVTCANGCSTCCRIQAVPVTPVEAYALLLLVEGLPEPRRSEVQARFEDRAARLHAAGLADDFLAGRRPASPEESHLLAKRYLELRLACPFLEADSCSIYSERPFTCREYFVTTPKELCCDPLSPSVGTVQVITQVFESDLATAAEFLGKSTYTLPLTLALEFARIHREELERSYDGSGVFMRSLAHFLVRLTI